MTRRWVTPLIRFSVYLYFAAGMALLASGWMVSALRYQADKRFPAIFLLAVFGGIFGMLSFASWDTFRRPISRRKWILLCILLLSRRLSTALRSDVVRRQWHIAHRCRKTQLVAYQVSIRRARDVPHLPRLNEFRKVAGRSLRNAN